MKSRFLVIILLIALSFGGSARAESDPTQPVRLLCDSLIFVMKQGAQLGFQGRENKLRPVVDSVYDMGAVTQNTLGLAAKKLSPEETSQLAAAYGHFSVATYADQFRAWDGERFEIDAPRPQANGTILVPSWIVGNDGSRTAIDYVMHDVNGSWRIVDVLFQGSVSQVAVRRSEFVPIFRQSGVGALIALLDGKSEALEKK